MTAPVHTAMVLAAGFGQRMRPLTLSTPKPLIPVAGKPLIGYGFDRLRQAGVARAIVNVHYLADQIEAWVAEQTAPRAIISDERDAILDTGGGIARALPLLGEDAFYVINSDSFWLDDGIPALERLRTRWDDAAMDCLLLLCPLDRTVGYDGTGDFVMGADGRIQRSARAAGEALAYIGGYLVSPRLFRDAPEGAFSMNLLWDRAIAARRLFGLVHHGRWLHVGTPQAIGPAEQALGD